MRGLECLRQPSHFIRKYCIHIRLHRETATKASFWGVWRFGGAEPSGQCRWRLSGAVWASLPFGLQLTLNHVISPPAFSAAGKQPLTAPRSPSGCCVGPSSSGVGPLYCAELLSPCCGPAGRPSACC